MDPIFQRVSIRQFTGQQVEPEKVEKLLQAAMAAPSATNQQPWEFVVVIEPETLRTLSQCTPYASPMDRASLGFVPCARTEGLRVPDFNQIDLSAATENLLLEAVELGLGAVWIGVAPREEVMDRVRKVLGIPANIQPFAMVACGYPAEEKAQQDRYDPARVHWGKW